MLTKRILTILISTKYRGCEGDIIKDDEGEELCDDGGDAAADNDG